MLNKPSRVDKKRGRIFNYSLFIYYTISITEYQKKENYQSSKLHMTLGFLQQSSEYKKNHNKINSYLSSFFQVAAFESSIRFAKRYNNHD